MVLLPFYLGVLRASKHQSIIVWSVDLILDLKFIFFVFLFYLVFLFLT